MKEMNTEEFKHVSFGLLVQFDQFCRNRGIKYSLAYGTLLGAVRHKGFIPWDDDVDVMLERGEYEKLINQFPDVYNVHYGIHSLRTDALWNRPYAKFFDNRTLIFENAPHNPLGQSVGIDIFPMDYLPNNKLLRLVKVLLIKMQGRVYSFKSVNKGYIKNRLKDLSFDIIKFCLRPFSKRKIAILNHRVAILFNDSKGKCMAYCCEGKYVNYSYDAHIFKNYKEIEFEGSIFQCVKDDEAFLEANYGDYMKLPPVEQRKSHHSFNAYWK